MADKKNAVAEKKKRDRKPPEEDEGKKTEMVARLKELLHKKYLKQLNKAALEEKALVIDFATLSKFSYELGEALLSQPDFLLECAKEAEEAIEGVPGPVPVRIMSLPEMTSIRDLRAKHLGRFLSVEGTVRRASEIRPEIQKVLWECPECGDIIEAYSEVGMIRKPFACNCGNRTGFIKKHSVLVDTRWVTIEEPFELTEGDRPSQINVVLNDDLVSRHGRRMTDPGNRIKVTGILRETPKGKIFSSKLDLFMSANHVEPTEIGWHMLDISEEDEKEIKRLAKDPKIYDLLVGSLAPSLYGLTEIKESIILQLFGGVPLHLRDKTHVRGDIHVLLIGDPAAGKSQLLKLVPEIVPRGKYVSGKGTTGAGLCTVYDSLVQMEDGGFVRIGELVENELSGNSKSHSEGITVASNPSRRKVLSLSGSSGKLKPMEITQYWKIKAPGKLVRITTRSGREVTVTPDNPILTMCNGILEWKKAAHLSDSDYVASARAIAKPPERDVPLADLVEDSVHVLESGDIVKRLVHEIRARGSIREYSARSGINENSLYHSWIRNDAVGNPDMGTLRGICRDMGMDYGELIPPRMRLSQYKGHEIMLPRHLNADLMYIAGLIAGDGSISSTAYGGMDIKFCSADECLLESFRRLCEKHLRAPLREESRGRIPYMRFRSKIFARILSELGIPHGKKSSSIRVSQMLSSLPDSLVRAYLQGIFDTDGSVQPRTSGSSVIELTTASREYARGIQLLLLRFGVLSSVRERRATESVIHGRTVRSGRKWSLEIRGENTSSFDGSVGFRLARKSARLDELISSSGKSNTNTDVVPGIAGLLRRARLSAGLSAKQLYGYKNYTYERGERSPSRVMLKRIADRLAEHSSGRDAETLMMLACSDILWERPRIGLIDNKEHEYVYDVTVEGEHSFMANGVIIHNTATVTKDEQFMGGWVLEAGAMVLANKGMLAVDEFEKMSPEDQVAMHEGLEQGTVSIAKASIVATLPAKTSVLAGGNPKFSRFDPYVPISKQITITDTLLSRFDLKFAIQDKPQSARDKSVVDHVIKTREDENFEGAMPKIDPAFIRKYIAYAREHCEPKFNKEAGKILRNFYIKTRKRSEGSGSVPITMRQFEALLRLSEASAKIQLQPEVRKEDAQRAIRLMKCSLKQLGLDPETGEIDIDRSEGGTPASERSKIRIVLDIIDKLSETKKEIALEELRSAARGDGVDDVDDIIERLKTQGLLFEPSPGFVQKV